jgi:hypothetical protein
MVIYEFFPEADFWLAIVLVTVQNVPVSTSAILGHSVCLAAAHWNDKGAIVRCYNVGEQCPAEQSASKHLSVT